MYKLLVCILNANYMHHTVPSGLPAPDVNPVASDTLSLLIYEPLEPNGRIILYNIIM